jgi:2'-5' RNA ligase
VRLFVAAYPPPEVRADFARAVRALAVGQPRPPGQSVRLAPADQVHLTLAFLGDVPDAKVDRAVTAVASTAAAHAPPTVRIAGGGTFGRGRFTVLWAGLTGETERVRAVADDLRRYLRRAKLPYDHKPMRAHVTVARPGGRLTPAERAADLAALAAYEGPEWALDEIRLMRSQLGPKPTYDMIYSAALVATTTR